MLNRYESFHYVGFILRTDKEKVSVMDAEPVVVTCPGTRMDPQQLAVVRTKIKFAGT